MYTIQLGTFMKRVWGQAQTFFSRMHPCRILASWYAMRTKEKCIVGILVALGITGSVWFGIRYYATHTIRTPSHGGILSEGLLQQPHSINPLLTDGNETDALIEALAFSGIMKSDGQGGVMPDLAESLEIKNNATQYVVTLRDRILWHDNQTLTTQDIAFTVDLMKKRELQHPLANFWNTVSVQVLSDKTIAFTLSKPYVFFPHYLTFKIIPKHLWETVPINQFLLSDFNIKPIGSGPYQFKKLTLDTRNAIKQYTLVRFGKYYGQGPYIDTINLKFYPDDTSAQVGLRKREIESLANILWDDIQSMHTQQTLKLLTPTIPNTIALFMNTDTDIVRDTQFRKAMNLGIDIQTIVRDVYYDSATILDAPALMASSTQRIFNPIQAQTLLETLGWKDSNANGTRDKKLTAKTKVPTELSLSLIYLETHDMQAIADHIARDAKAMGIDITATPVRTNEFTSRINNRSFQLALASETTLTGLIPDLYPFWHSSQKNAPGLNISQYANKEVDSIVEELRKTTDPERVQILRDGFTNRMHQDVPAIFLVQPQWTWALENHIHTPAISFINTPAQRFDRINEWYIYTKRIWIQ